MARLLSAWVAMVTARPRLVLLLTVLAAVGAIALSIARLGIDTSIDDMIDEDLPYRKAQSEIAAAFPATRETLVVLVEGEDRLAALEAGQRIAERLSAPDQPFAEVFFPAAMPFFQRSALLFRPLEELRELSDQLAEAAPLLGPLASDPSLRGLSAALETAIGSGEEDSRLDDFLAELAATVESLNEEGGQARRLDWESAVEGEAAPPRALIFLRARLDYGTLAPAKAALEAIRAAALAESEATPGLEVLVTGRPALLQDELKSVKEGTELTAAISLLLVSFLLWVGLRAGSLIAATLLALLVGLALTGGFATLAIGRLNLLSVAFAVLFIGLSVDFGIHFALRYRETLGEVVERRPALVEVARRLGAALALAAFTAALGFMAFLPTDYIGLSELGLISAAGMAVALFVNLTVLPAALAVLPTPKRGLRSVEQVLGGSGTNWLERHPRAVVTAAALVGLASLAALPFAYFDDDPMNLRDPGAESMRALELLAEQPEVETYSAYLLAPDLATAEAEAARLAALPEVASTRTLASLVPKDQDEKFYVIDDIALYLGPVLFATRLPPPDAADRERALIALRSALEDSGLAAARRLDEALRQVPQDPASLARLEAMLVGGLPPLLDRLGGALEAEPVSLEELPQALTARWVAPDGRALVEILAAEDPRDPAVRGLFVEAVAGAAPGVGGSIVGITRGGQVVTRAFLEAGVLAALAILVVLFFVLRSVRDVGLVMVPLVLSALLTVASGVVLGLPFNFANVIVLPLLCGLGVAGGIHLVTRSRAAGETDRAAGTQSAAEVMASSTPRAVLFSALTTIGSFGALAISTHRGTASMGILLTIALAWILVSTLVVLPALIRLLRPSGR